MEKTGKKFVDSRQGESQAAEDSASQARRSSRLCCAVAFNLLLLLLCVFALACCLVFNVKLLGLQDRVRDLEAECGSGLSEDRLSELIDSRVEQLFAEKLETHLARHRRERETTECKCPPGPPGRRGKRGRKGDTGIAILHTNTKLHL
ncbi:collagen alpha-1(XXV) chain-like [Branchiostoma lanceolatum]|uniref:collagen alpha-1(XXV) chain-like n=1 Tax=Branchiostoma lanceolatum TaxID=7740 RepID=UPI003453B0F3